MFAEKDFSEMGTKTLNMPSMAAPMREWAHYYRSRNWPVFPLHPRSKTPIQDGGFHNATTNYSAVDSWWRQYPAANIGLWCKPIVVLDADRHGNGDGVANLEKLQEERGTLPETPEVLTGNEGYHYYFLSHVELRGGNNRLGQAIDIKGVNGYAVLPPSIHPDTGEPYIWSVTPEEASLAPIPEWIVEKLSEKAASSGLQPDSQKPVSEGERNDFLFGQACAMRRRGMSERAILEGLKVENEERCASPLAEEEVARIAESAMRYNPGGKSPEVTSKPILVPVSHVERRKIPWLWPSRFAIGKLSLMAGDPGVGKSHALLDLIARITTGSHFPDGSGSPMKGSCILLTAEDDIADTVRPRLEAAGADLDLVHVLQGVEYTKGDKTIRRSITLADIGILQEVIKETADLRLVGIDPVTAYLGKIDSHRNADVRGLLAPLAELAGRHEVAIVGVTHLNKGGGIKALYRLTGSLAFSAAARSVWGIAEDEDEPGRCLFLPIKNNLAASVHGLAYRLEPWEEDTDYARIVWEKTPVMVDANEIMNPIQPEPRHMWEEAAQWLTSILKNGPVEADKILKQGKNFGFSDSVLYTAKRKLKIESARSGYGKDGEWAWQFPKPK